VANGSVHYNTLLAIGILLFVITFIVNSLAGRLVGTQGKRRRNSQL
jgi:ABC-type phosphate transport system permease subunit